MTEVCACHGVPKQGHGRCRVLKRERDLRYLYETEKGRARQRRFRDRETFVAREAAIQSYEEALRSPTTV